VKKIAFIGIRGIPVVYSGFESFVEDLTVNINGFDFFVYCRSRYVQKKRHNRVHLIYTPTIYLYKLETFIHSLISSIHAALFLKPSIIFYLGVGNAPFILIPKLFGIKTIINVDGMDWNREKWGKFGRWYLSFCAFLSTKLADTVVTDSLYSQKYYKKKFNKETIFISYIINGYKWKEKKEVLKRYNLIKGEYFVWAGRLVPDNHLEDVLNIYMSTKLAKKLVVIGDDNYQTKYVKKIKKLIEKNKNVIHTGFLPRDEYLTVIKNSYAYIETKRSGGTHPTLLDGLTYAPLVICNDFISNKKILMNSCIYYSSKIGSRSLLKKILYLEKLTNASINKFQSKQKYLLSKFYNYRKIVTKYKSLFLNTLKSE
jgi:glycosyltransferase involved in cell wall biosynthesis